jgi:glycosyltransferase involved in cell wall biosynthesis
VVSTNVGGIPYLVEHEKTALLVPPRNAQAMAEAILALLNDPPKAQRISSAGMESVQRYTWPSVRDQLLSVYERVLVRSQKSVASEVKAR